MPPSQRVFEMFINTTQIPLCVVINTRAKRLTVARGGQIIDQRTGEIEGVTEIAQVITVEKAEFIKLFTKDISIWFDLNRTALRVFAALLMIYQKDAVRSDLLYFHNEDERIKDFKIRKASWFIGLEELLSKGFLARHVRTSWYYINPSMFFNGDRARFVKEYNVEKEKPKAKKSDNQLELDLPIKHDDASFELAQNKINNEG